MLTVFLVLICIVLLCRISGAVFGDMSKKNVSDKQAQAQAMQSVAVPDTVIENRKEILASVCAVLAEENGIDVNSIRVVSFKRVK